MFKLTFFCFVFDSSPTVWSAEFLLLSSFFLLFFINLHRPLAAKLGCGSLKSRAQRQVVSYDEKPDDVIVRFFCCFFFRYELVRVPYGTQISRDTESCRREKKADICRSRSLAGDHRWLRCAYKSEKTTALCDTCSKKEKKTIDSDSGDSFALFNFLFCLCSFFSLICALIQIYVNFWWRLISPSYWFYGLELIY